MRSLRTGGVVGSIPTPHRLHWDGDNRFFLGLRHPKQADCATAQLWLHLGLYRLEQLEVQLSIVPVYVSF